MQKRHQIDKQRAVREFQKFASEVNPKIQTILPLSDVVGMLQAGGHLIREAGLLLMMGIMEEEVRDVVGERSVPRHRECCSGEFAVGRAAGAGLGFQCVAPLHSRLRQSCRRRPGGSRPPTQLEIRWHELPDTLYFSCLDIHGAVLHYRVYLMECLG